MQFEGARVTVDGIPGRDAPLRRLGSVWQAVFRWVPRGAYSSGSVQFPDGSVLAYGMTRTQTFATSGHLYLVFREDDAVGAEITRRMVALAA